MVKVFTLQDYSDMVDSLFTIYGYRLEDVQWKSWPELYSSTSGSHKGRIGGRAMTYFQKFLFTFPDGSTSCYCDGVWEYINVTSGDDNETYSS